MEEMNQIAKKTLNAPLTSFAKQYDIDPTAMADVLRNTAFKQSGDEEVTNEQMAALMIVADQHKLNPFLKEIYAFPDKKGGIVPVVGVDGWSNMINSNKNFDGMEFRQSETMIQEDGAKPCPEWMEVILHRKDRAKPVVIREYLDEVYRPGFKKNNYVVTGPWQTHTKRMLRHKAMIQGARLCFGFSGIYDEDEAARIIEARESDITNAAYEEIEIDNDVYKNNDGSMLTSIVHPTRAEQVKERLQTAANDPSAEPLPGLSTADKTILKGRISKARSNEALEKLLPDCAKFSNTPYADELRAAYAKRKKELT